MSAGKNEYKKIVVAAILTLQVTCMVLTLRYSKTTTKYLSSTAVVNAEVVKMFICVFVLSYQHGTSVISHLNDELFSKPRDMLLCATPALLYLIQNNLLFYAIERLDAAVYQVTYQLKILATALCTVLMLDRYISKQKWIALFVLTIGVSLAQFQPTTNTIHDSNAASMGVIALLIACFTSGFAGVYTEKLLKQTTASLWIRNIQLAIWSAVVGIIGVYYSSDGVEVREHGFFNGYTRLVWFVVLLQASSGIIVALTIKIADNIVKNFSVAMSLLLSTLISIPLFDFKPSPYFIFGASMVLFSVWLYSLQHTLKMPWQKVEEPEAMC
eukprot:TRINITY_DN130_c3_g1_i1.p1 TRINITY_DN130_c3_g1~~TRINITY_DN130_c3_g1_i1.p1  ORF type:complete len:327 (+),score=45.20 TRINITY_DN130_c3_g1_i1:112-1092(+)